LSLLLVQADARYLPFADGSVQCCVTSPPYWGLRDYGTSGQLGLEATPDAYVLSMVQVFREVWRVLRDDGVCWLNLGDSYNGGGGAGSDTALVPGVKQYKNTGSLGIVGRLNLSSIAPKKSLLGIPWRVALALIEDGWCLRSDVIWHKPDSMPESVRDRPTKSHEYLFMLVRSGSYFYDASAIREPQSDLTLSMYSHNDSGGSINPDKCRNVRSVWVYPQSHYRGAHFATMPEKLVERCVLAGSKAGDVILDPFMGSGTVARVALRLGRRAIGCDLNPAYLALADDRTRVTYGLPLEGEDVA
jgi:DNA modification methylase